MSEVAQSDDTTPSYVGTGAPTVTSMDGLSNTGIVWITSRDGELSAYRAIPVSELTPSRTLLTWQWVTDVKPDGKLERMILPTGIKSTKFQRPAFGNGRVYMSTSTGHIACYGKKS